MKIETTLARSPPSRAERKVTAGKIRRDASLLREHAAAVLVLDRCGNIVEEIKRNPRSDDMNVVRLIVVLAPAEYCGEFLPETSVLEIGFSRSRPYRQVEKYLLGGLDFFIKPRTPVRKLTLVEYVRIAPRLFALMREMLFTLRESWLSKRAWQVGPKQMEYERGIYFTADRSDTLLCADLLRADLCWRREHYFGRHAALLRGWMGRHVASRDVWSDKELLRFTWAAKIVAHLEILRLPAHYVREFRQRFTPGQWELLERLCVIAEIALPEESAETQLIDAVSVCELPETEGISFILKHDERKRHARDCLVVEAVFRKDYREANEIPF